MKHITLTIGVLGMLVATLLSSCATVPHYTDKEKMLNPIVMAFPSGIKKVEQEFKVNPAVVNQGAYLTLDTTITGVGEVTICYYKSYHPAKGVVMAFLIKDAIEIAGIKMHGTISLNKKGFVTSTSFTKRLFDETVSDFYTAQNISSTIFKAFN